ncbi:MAG: Tex family protein [Clostridia bacterium]
MDINAIISKELTIQQTQIDSAVRLMDEGNTVPFIARYRKEVTGSLDDAQLRDISDRLTSLRNLEKRRNEIIASIESQDAMTPELISGIQSAQTLSTLEDLYLPYKKKRNTRATIAKAKGLEPLALSIFAQKADVLPALLAKDYIDAEKGVTDVAEALAGAQDILAEMISDNARVRGSLRLLMERTSSIHTSSNKQEPGTYSMYYDLTEKLIKLPPHRILAINRGEKEGVLKVCIDTDMDAALSMVRQKVLTTATPNACTEVVVDACQDSLKRLLYPSLENELRTKLFNAAAEQAIHVFALNLKPLLMAPPLKNRVTMGFDPAYRTGCKIAVVDATGKVLAVDVVYPTPPQSKVEEAREKLTALIKKHHVTAIAIGNGTASKESEIFVSDLLKALDVKVDYMVVSEAGASVYSASPLGTKEFPQFDVSLRSAISIARRLQDPLAELVKIDPQAIGVGQYQHDMPQKRLGEALGGVVEDCVNSVGVDVNTASVSLLSHIAGIGPSLAQNIVNSREQNGCFPSRKALMDVPKLGKKAFEQAAGFLRVPDGDDPLDNTAVHPESYAAAKKLLKLCGLQLQSLRVGGATELNEKIKAYGEPALAKELDIGVPTLRDMVSELSKPGRDPREEMIPLAMHSDLKDLSDLKANMVLDGTVRNVVDFGVFVDIGVHQDGLVHISRICDRYIKHPSEVLHVGEIVRVKILEVDAQRKRISLTMRDV